MVQHGERKEGDVAITTSNHEDLGHVTLRREGDACTLKAQEIGYVRQWGDQVPEVG